MDGEANPVAHPMVKLVTIAGLINQAPASRVESVATLPNFDLVNYRLAGRIDNLVDIT